MAQQRNLRRNCRGMTLVELMMVISIMTILMAVAIPLIRPAFQDRQLREASRQINAFFAGAKARAAETGRPLACGSRRMACRANRNTPSACTRPRSVPILPARCLGEEQSSFSDDPAPPVPRPSHGGQYDEPVGQLHL